MKNIAYLLLFFLLVSGHTNATAVGGSIGGWNVVSNVASGIGAKITATKEVFVNGAKTTVTGTANIMPNPSNMGKFMLRLGGAAIVSEALNQILDGVDYVMDPANNSVTYKDKNSVDPSKTSPNKFQTTDGVFLSYGSFDDAVKAQFEILHNRSPDTYQTLTSFSDRHLYPADSPYRAYEIKYKGFDVDQTAYFLIQRVVNPAYDPSVEEEKKTVPLSDIGQQVIDQAQEDIKAGNVASPAVVLSRAVAQDMIQEAEADDVKARPIAQELEKNPEYPSDNDAEGEITKPEVIDPATGEVVKPAETSSIAMKFPEACKWFPQACLFIDWMMQDYQEETPPELPKEELDKKDIDEDLIKLNGSSCPAPLDVSIALPMFNTTYNDSIDISEYCTKLEDLAPVLQLISIVIAVMILARI